MFCGQPSLNHRKKVVSNSRMAVDRIGWLLCPNDPNVMAVKESRHPSVFVLFLLFFCFFVFFERERKEKDRKRGSRKSTRTLSLLCPIILSTWLFLFHFSLFNGNPITEISWRRRISQIPSPYEYSNVVSAVFRGTNGWLWLWNIIHKYFSFWASIWTLEDRKGEINLKWNWNEMKVFDVKERRNRTEAGEMKLTLQGRFVPLHKSRILWNTFRRNLRKCLRT